MPQAASSSTAASSARRRARPARRGSISPAPGGTVAELFAGSVVDARVISEESVPPRQSRWPTQRWTKGTAAMLLAIRELARARGRRGGAARGVGPVAARAPRALRRAARSAEAKGWRWVGEMEEIAATFEAAGCRTASTSGCGGLPRADEHPPRRADPPGRAAVRAEGLPRHLDRRDRRGARRPERLALRPHRLEAGPALRDDARRRARLPRGPRRDRRGAAGRPRRSGSRSARTCASSPTSSTSRPCSCRSGATSRASGATRSSPSGGATRSGSARSSARAASSASCAATSTTRPRRCSRSRPRTGPTPGCAPARDTNELADRFYALLVDGMRGYATPAA